MNIYLLSQNENNTWDTYDSCVVIADSEEEAKTIHPNGYVKWYPEYNKWSYSDTGYYYRCDWCTNPDKVMVEYIGEFKGNLEDYTRKIICSSFNAG